MMHWFSNQGWVSDGRNLFLLCQRFILILTGLNRQKLS